MTSVLHERESISLALLCKIMQWGSVAPIIQLLSPEDQFRKQLHTINNVFPKASAHPREAATQLSKPLLSVPFISVVPQSGRYYGELSSDDFTERDSGD